MFYIANIHISMRRNVDCSETKTLMVIESYIWHGSTLSWTPKEGLFMCPRLSSPGSLFKRLAYPTFTGWPAASSEPHIASGRRRAARSRCKRRLHPIKMSHSVFWMVRVCVSQLSRPRKHISQGDWPSYWPRQQRHVSVPEVVIQGHLTLPFTHR